MKTTTTDLIEQILDAADKRAPVAEIVPRHDYIHRETGQKYGAFGIPFGVKREDLDPGPIYWVFQGSNGTTYGDRYKTEADAEFAKDRKRLNVRESFREAMADMDDDALASQAAYWLGED